MYKVKLSPNQLLASVPRKKVGKHGCLVMQERLEWVGKKEESRSPLGTAVHLVETGQIILNPDEKERRAERNEPVPAAPSGDFSGFFFPSKWDSESRISLSYKPLSFSLNPRDMGHFQPPGSPFCQNELTDNFALKRRHRKFRLAGI